MQKIRAWPSIRSAHVKKERKNREGLHQWGGLTAAVLRGLGRRYNFGASETVSMYQFSFAAFAAVASPFMGAKGARSAKSLCQPFKIVFRNVARTHSVTCGSCRLSEAVAFASHASMEAILSCSCLAHTTAD